ncbi:uncharacterized protein LOC127750133 [Frankliniella occidentalis]|uniref:Uncharacterized protein LOC127750133 n=1 Tax=Frankliniella occidentalis TaxID=133901 RepID=A0A9C6WSQ2_FRAOC|nr:uncharacterized protein LOC127750133 [Frankliniella occidentalis]
MEFPEWSKCHIERQCGSPHDGHCSECDAEDLTCRTLCGWNCACRCMGWPTGGLDADSHDRWDKCYEERGCTLSKREECQKNCGSSESCKNLCIMDRERCSCGCIQHAAASRTESAPAATTATSTRHHH